MTDWTAGHPTLTQRLCDRLIRDAEVERTQREHAEQQARVQRRMAPVRAACVAVTWPARSWARSPCALG